MPSDVLPVAMFIALDIMSELDFSANSAARPKEKLNTMSSLFQNTMPVFKGL